MPKFLHTGHFSGSSTDLTLDGQLFLPSTTSDPGASPAISFDSGAGGIFYDSDDDHLWFRAGGGKRAYVSNAGIISQANVYSGSNSQFRNYAGVWAGTTGIAGNGFYFLNTANSNTTKAMELTSTGSIMTVNGEVRATKYVDKANTSYFINPKADSATADAAMLLGRVRIGSNEAGAISQFGVGGRTQIQTMNYKAGAYGADGQNNGITVLANDATISNSFMGTTALVLHNTGAISTKSLFRITRTSGRTSTPFSTGLGSYSVKFDIKGNGDVDVKGNIRTTQDIGRDDHNRIMFSTDNSIIYRVADSHRFRMDSDNLSPYADSSYDLGTNSVRWRNVYADTLYGDGSNLTNLPSGNTTTINNNANNRVITGSGTADTLEAESGLTFDGDILEITGSGTTTKRMKVSPGTDYGRAHIGRAALGKLGWDDHAGFSHEDHNSQNNYALLQDETGTTYINAAQNKTGYLRTNNQTRAYWTGSGFYSSIYYDSNDTNYYVNPNGASNINSLTVGEVVTSNHIYGRSVNNQYSLLYRFGGLFLTWDSDTYGTQLNHSITSTDNGAYSDSITINSYDKVRINIDSNNNDSASTFTVGHHGTGSSGYLLHLDESGHHTVTGSSRAPIFYDSNDTNYYVDPASTSVVNHMDMDTANTSGKFAVMSSGVHGTYDFYNNGTSYLNGAVIIDDALDLTGSNRALKIAGTTRINSVGDIIGTSYYVGSTNIVDTNRNLVNIAGITSTGNAVFGNSNTDKVVIHGNLGIGDDTYPKIAYPGQNALWGGSGSTTGQIVIDLPGTLGNYDMMYMEIDIYEYSGDAATKLIIGGHNWNSGGNSNTDTTQWYNVNVQVLGSLTKPVYFGRRNDGSNERRCIAIGETTSTWSYATVHVHKVHGAEFYGTAIDWVGDWNIAQTTSTSYFTKNPTTNFNDGGSQTFETNGIGEANHWFGSTSVRSPIFYDLDNTAYYADLAGATSINLAGRITGNSSQNRVKYSVWTGSTYGIGMKNGFDYGHIGSNEYAMTFQMNDDNSRGFWWGDTGHNDNQGAMSLTTNGRLVVANSISIGEGESVTSPSMETLFVGGDVLIDGGETTTLHVKCDNSGNAIIRAGGDSQGTGVFEVTQDGSYGGGMSYNGDASPTWASGETADHITFYRMDNNTRTEVFHYPYNSSVVNFNSTPTITSSDGTVSNIAKVSDIPTNNNQLTNGAGYLTSITSHNHAATDITSGTLNDARLSDNVFVTRSATVGTASDWDDFIIQGTYGVASSAGAQFTGDNRPTHTKDGVTFEPDYRYGHLVVTEDNGQGIQQTYYPHSGTQKVFTRTGWSNASWGDWSMNWNTRNMGAGSNLDADKLDGQQGTHYLDYNNFTNKPTIPTNNNQLTNGAGYLTSLPSTINAGVLEIDGNKVLDMPNNSTQRGPWNPIATFVRGSGTAVYGDEDFVSGSNNVYVYNNQGGTGVQHFREEDGTTLNQIAPNSSGYVIRVVNNGNNTSPGRGGFYQTISSANNQTFVQVFQAKLETGKSFQIAENSQGTNKTSYWLSNNHGTGKFEWYVRVSHCGDSGTFSSGGHVYVNGGSANEVFTWYLASSEIYKVTDAQNKRIRSYIATSSMISPVYYDTNTSYYLDAGSTGTSLNVAGGGTFQKQLVIDSNGSTDNYYITMSESGATRFTIYENSNNIYFNGWSGHTIFRPQMAGSGSFAVTQGNTQFDTSGNATFAGTITASGYNNSNWDTAYGWGNHADEGYLTSLPSHNHDDRYYTETEVTNYLANKTNLNDIRSLGTQASTGGSSTTITTADFISEIESDGAFDSYSSVFKNSWSYAGNKDLSDAGRFTETAGASFLTWTDNSSDTARGNITLLAVCPNTGGSNGKVFIYNDQGSSYAPGWREVWTNTSDGAGSGLDADKLDGQEGSYYLNYNNLSNKPSIPGDTNYYLDGITKLDNTLTFSVNGATNQTYTFGSNAFNSTTIPTHTSSLTNNSGFITASATVDKANGLAEVGYGSDEMTFQQLSSSFAGYTGGWANYFIGNHGNGSNYYNTVHIMPFWGTPKYSRLENNNLKGPFNYLTDETNHTTNYTLGAAKFQQHNNSNRYLIPSGTSLLDSINLYGSAPLSLTSRYGGFGDVCSYGGRMLGYSRGAAGAVLGVNKSGQVFEYEKIFTFKVSGNGWVNRSSNPFKILQAPGTDKMIIVDEFLVYIDYESGNGNTGLGYNGYLARVTDSAAYSIGFYANESGQSQSQASHGVSSNFYTLGIMPGGFMNNTTDRGYYRDVPVHQSALIANRSLFFKTHRNCTSINNAPGGAHYIKIKYRVVDISEEFSNAGVDYTLSSSSYHGQYAHNADGGKQYNDSGQESGVC